MVRKFKIIHEWVNSFFANFPYKRSQKKFNIIEESFVAGQKESSINSDKFRNSSQTRPQICPVCRTSEISRPGNIFFTTRKKWGCKACGHEWGG